MRFLLPGILLLSLPILADDESDFSSAPLGWQSYSPLSPLYPASFDFSGGQCHINCPAPSYEVAVTLGYGGARGGLFAPSVMTDSVASVDISAWTPSENRETDGIHMFVLTRVQTPIGLGSLNGYAAVVIDMGANSGPGGSRNGRLQFMRLVAEQPAFIHPDYVDFTFNPDHDYRLILASIGTTHTVRIFNLTVPEPPIPQLVVNDGTYSEGRTGFIIYNDRLAPLDVTFDNFLAWDGTPPPIVIQPGGEPGTMALSSDLHRALGSDLQTTTDFTDPLAPWEPAIPAAVSVVGNQLFTIFPIDGPRRFFRRKSL